MARWAREKHTPRPKPVQKVELSESNVPFRIALVVLLLVIGISFIGVGIHSIFSIKEGWTEIEADSSADANVGNEFVFMYNLGSVDMSATAEKKLLKALYTEIMVEAYQIFHNNQDFENVKNVYYVNQHPNEEIEVDEMLYDAFALLKEYDNRNIYLAPVYGQYDDIFFCEDDSQIVSYDPYLNSEVAALYLEIASFAKDSKAVEVQLIGDNRIRLFVSDEYMAFCKENDITTYIDFSWMKNAFIIDYLADALAVKGYTYGTVSSYDGFSRNLDVTGMEFSLNLYDVQKNSINEKIVYQVATMQYSGSKSIVSMRNFKVNTMDEYRYYELDNGEIRSLYLDISDGLCKTAVKDLYSYSKEYSCSEIMLQVAPIYIAEELQEDDLSALSLKGIESIYCKDCIIRYTENSLQLKDLYSNDQIHYVSEVIE